MRWDSLFADLEAQAVAHDNAERAAEVEERTRGEVGGLAVLDRLRAGIGCAVRLRLPAARTVAGTLGRVGPDWLLITDDTGREVVVPLTGLLGIRGLTRHAGPAGDLVSARLGLRHVLRGIARDRSAVRIELVDGTSVDATIDRVGADFVEAAGHAAAEVRRRSEVRDVEVLALAAIVAVRRAA